ncbi:MAG: hypothetical protein E7578_01730 [Ruminococcaceae bacterium]|nr:hypothetical protein [Oscillospiraceae bacterium]
MDPLKKKLEYKYFNEDIIKYLPTDEEAVIESYPFFREGGGERGGNEGYACFSKEVKRKTLHFRQSGECRKAQTF